MSQIDQWGVQEMRKIFVANDQFEPDLLGRNVIESHVNGISDPLELQRFVAAWEGLNPMDHNTLLTPAAALDLAKEISKGTFTGPLEIRKIVGASVIFNHEILTYTEADFRVAEMCEDLGVDCKINVVGAVEAAIAMRFPEHAELAREVMNLNMFVIREAAKIRSQRNGRPINLTTSRDPKWNNKDYEERRNKNGRFFWEAWQQKWNPGDPEQKTGYIAHQVVEQLTRFVGRHEVSAAEIREMIARGDEIPESHALKKSIQYTMAFDVISGVRDQSIRKIIRIPRGSLGLYRATEVLDFLEQEEQQKRERAFEPTLTGSLADLSEAEIFRMMKAKVVEPNKNCVFVDPTTLRNVGYDGNTWCVPLDMFSTPYGKKVFISQMSHPRFTNKDKFPGEPRGEDNKKARGRLSRAAGLSRGGFANFNYDHPEQLSESYDEFNLTSSQMILRANAEEMYGLLAKILAKPKAQRLIARILELTPQDIRGKQMEHFEEMACWIYRQESPDDERYFVNP